MTDKEFTNLLRKIYVEADDSILSGFKKYYELLVEWNSFMNLTGITEYDEVIVKHFVDSLAVNKAIVDISLKDKSIGELLNLKSDISVVDVGTGAGFPGLPIKIAFSDTKVCLIDSLNKRIKFLDEVINQLGLKNIETIHTRAEDGARNPQLREQYTLGVSRAVANLATLSEYVLPYVKVGGYFVALKSGEIDEEAEAAKRAISILGGQTEHIYRFTLPNTDIERSCVFIKKIKSTPKKYPRKSGLPSKEPLK